MQLKQHLLHDMLEKCISWSKCLSLVHSSMCYYNTPLNYRLKTRMGNTLNKFVNIQQDKLKYLTNKKATGKKE